MRRYRDPAGLVHVPSIADRMGRASEHQTACEYMQGVVYWRGYDLALARDEEVTTCLECIVS